MAAPGWDRAQVLPGPGAAPGRPHPVQASAVALDGAGIVIVGPPGVGKSTLAMHLLSLGAALVGDDAVTLTGSAAGVRVGPPARAAADADTGPDPHTATATAAGDCRLVEARGIGLLRVPAPAAATPLRLVVDLGVAEPCRLPPRRMVACLGHRIELILSVPLPTLAPAIPILVRHGRVH